MRSELAANAVHDGKLLNSSVKQPLGASPNALLFGNATVQEPGMMAEIDQMPSDTTKTLG